MSDDLSGELGRAAAVVDLTAIADNTRVLARAAGDAQVMAVVKADGYGHGIVPAARAALAGGASWLGVAYPSEALELRRAGLTAPTLAWLSAPGDDLAAAVAADIDLAAYDIPMLDRVAKAATEAGRPARVHLKIDTGLNRGGMRPEGWRELCAAAAAAQTDGTLTVVGVFSHFVYADSPTHPTIDSQLAVFHAAVASAERAGLAPLVRHIANSAATLTRPDTHLDLVRPGLALYGLSPVPEVDTAAALGLRPAMTLAARVALTKRVPTGAGVSYGHRYRTSRETTLALVPLGYADGVPRAAGNLVQVLLAGSHRTIAGTVCMDQLMLDVGDDPVTVGDQVTLFGPGDRGEPTAQDWADALGTISYEIVTGIGARTPRRYLGEASL